jgi:hypothetical protein
MLRVCFFRRKTAEENNGLGHIARTTRIDRVRGGDVTQIKNARSSTSVQCFVRARTRTRTQHRGTRTRTRSDLV